MPAGAPTKYKPSHCKSVVDLGKIGKSVTQMACALDVHKDTLYEWEKVHPEFSDALARARQESQAFWEQIGQDALFAEKFQPSVYNKQMSCRFPKDWRDNSAIDLSNEDGSMKPETYVFYLPRDGRNPEIEERLMKDGKENRD